MFSSSIPERTDSARLVRMACVVAACVCVVAFATSVWLRTQHFNDPDSMNIVDVATNIAAGRGITQSTLGFLHTSFEATGAIPTPMTAQPPLVPIAISTLIAAGLEPIGAGVFFSLFCYAAIIALVWRVSQLVHGSDVAPLACGIVLFHAPLRYYSSSSMSDPAGLAGILLTLWSVLILISRRDSNFWLPLAIGLAAGLTCAARYALAPIAAVAFIAAWISCSNRLVAVAAYLTGAAVPVLLTVARNLSIEGVLAPGYLPSTRGLTTNLTDALWFLTGAYVGPWPIPSQTVTALVVALLLTGTLLARAKGRAVVAARQAFLDNGGFILTAWNVLYFVFVITYTSANHVDELKTGRLLLPIVPTLLIQMAAYIARCFAFRPLHTHVAGLLSIVATMAVIAVVYGNTPEFSVSRTIESSARLSWIRDNTTNRDLIIGEDVVDVPFYLQRTAAVSFSPYPYTQHLSYDKAVAVCRHHLLPDAHAFLVLSFRNWPSDETRIRAQYGEFIADLRAGLGGQYALVQEVARFTDGVVFELNCR